jgi:hypothetical protein
MKWHELLFIWSPERGVFFSKNTDRPHVRMAEELGLPSHGPAYDRMVKGMVEVDPDEKLVIATTHIPDVPLYYKPDEVVKALKRMYPRFEVEHGPVKWVKKGAENEPWESTREQYAPYPKVVKDKDGKEIFEESDEENRERHKRRQDWEQSALAAISEGRLDPNEAKKRGLYLPGTFKPLPSGPLYHVTTAFSKVKSEGLKTRWQMAMGEGTGLGGGTSMAISFTEDMQTALGIYDALVEGRKVINGQLTVQQMLEQAATGAGAKRPWLKEAVSWGGAYLSSDPDWNPGKPYPIHLQALLDGMKIESPGFGGIRQEDMPAGSEPVGEGWTDGAGKQRYHYYRTPTNESEKRERAFDFYKTWCAARENAGGALNPLFFSSDTEALGKVSDSEVAILEFKANPGAMGTKESALGEWRTYSGRAVTFVGTVNPQAKIAARNVPEFLYHGTSANSLPNILQAGLHERSYFTTEPLARWFAEQAQRETGADPVLIKVPSRRLKLHDLDEVKRLLPPVYVKDTRIWRYLHSVPVTETDVIRLPRWTDPEEGKTASQQFTPEEMEHEAYAFQDQFGSKGEPPAGPASQYVWHQDDHFPVEKLDGDAASWKKWFDQEKAWAGEDGREGYYRDMESWWTSNPNEHIIVVQGLDGKYYVWEGTHRQAISKIHGMKTVPAFVGIPKQGKTSSTVYFHASDQELPIGTLLKPSGEPSQFWEREEFLEEHRPENKLSRLQSVFMGVTAEEVKMWGPHVYEVEPIGTVERNDVNWFEELVYLEDIEEKFMAADTEEEEQRIEDLRERMKDAANNYWEGKPGPHHQWWEYRVPSARVLKKVDGTLQNPLP